MTNELMDKVLAEEWETGVAYNAFTHNPSLRSIYWNDGNYARIIAVVEFEDSRSDGTPRERARARVIVAAPMMLRALDGIDAYAAAGLELPPGSQRDTLMAIKAIAGDILAALREAE